MIRTRSVAKRQKIEECKPCMESVMFNNSDSLFKIASYLPPEGLLNLALTCRRFGIGGDDSLSLIEATARMIVHDVATDEEKNALPCFDGDNWLCKYNYLQSLRIPLAFDQLVGSIEYAEGEKTRVVANNESAHLGATAFSNNIMMAGKHYVSFEAYNGNGILLGVMRPGEAMQSAGRDPLEPEFFNHFTQREGSVQYNNSVSCCMYFAYDGNCYSCDWEGDYVNQPWNGMERFSGPCKIGMLLDLDEGTLSVYKNGRKLGVMKRGLAGHYCWVVTMTPGTKVTIKQGTVPASRG